MGQKLYTKQFGEISVEKSWAEGPHHIALLSNGAYAHITGNPIGSKQELRACLRGEELVAAENWFDHRHDEVKGKSKRVIFEADGTPMFEDGTPVTSPSDLLEALQPGPILDAALMALARAQDARNKVEASKSSKAGKAAVTAKKKAPPKKAQMPEPATEGASITV